MSRLLSWMFALGILAILILGPLVYVIYRPLHVRNLRVVKDNVLYRSGQPSLMGLKDLVHDYGIRTVITLRDAMTPGEPPPSLEEERYCEAEGITYCRITPRKWAAPDGSVPAAEGVRKFLAIMDDRANYPVLIHCFAGVHRTGAYCAIYRMEYDSWTNEEAIAEMRACGYKDLEDEWDLLGFLETYQRRRK